MEALLMIRNILTSLVLLLLAPVSHGQDKGSYEQVKLSVMEFFKRTAASSTSCDVMRDVLARDPANEQNKKMMVGFCDSDINILRPVSFSEMRAHEFEGDYYVCGVISGETMLGRKIGARFISAEPYHLIISIKYSRRPIAYATNDGFLADEYKNQLRSFNELNRKYCQ